MLKLLRFCITEGLRQDYILKGGINNMEIKRDTKIGDLLEAYPEKADILLEVGMHCLGCPASQLETLEEACEVHGIDIEELLQKLQA